MTNNLQDVEGGLLLAAAALLYIKFGREPTPEEICDLAEQYIETAKQMVEEQ